jgi:hypothetical protein
MGDNYATETVYRTAGCRLRGEGHEVDLLLHEDLNDPTSTRGDLSQKKKECRCSRCYK